MNGTQVFKTKLLPGGGFHVAGPVQVPGHRGCPRVVVMEWPLPLVGQGLHKGVAHVCENDDGPPPHAISYTKIWCQFHGRHHFYLDIADLYGGFGQVNRPALEFARLETLFMQRAGGEAGGPQAVHGGDTAGGVNPDGGGGGGGDNVNYCIGMRYCDAMFFWDDGANEDVPGGD